LNNEENHVGPQVVSVSNSHPAEFKQDLINQSSYSSHIQEKPNMAPRPDDIVIENEKLDDENKKPDESHN
jgi:hypothetical protein